MFIWLDFLHCPTSQNWNNQCTAYTWNGKKFNRFLMPLFSYLVRHNHRREFDSAILNLTVSKRTLSDEVVTWAAKTRHDRRRQDSEEKLCHIKIWGLDQTRSKSHSTLVENDCPPICTSSSSLLCTVCPRAKSFRIHASPVFA